MSGSRTSADEALQAGAPGLGWLPRLALGCGNFGGIGSAPEFFGQGLDDEEANALMDAAWEMGITHFDTADAYGGGRSEAAIGRWIARNGVRPTLTSKTFHPLVEGGDRGLGPDRVTHSVQASLERLGVSRIDLYLAHEPDPSLSPKEALEGFEREQREGRIGAYGVSNFSARQLEQSLAAGRPVAVQNGYSLLQREDDPAVLDLCDGHGVAYIAFSPLFGGWLAGRYRRGQTYPEGSRMRQRPGPYLATATERTFDALEALERFAAGRGISMAGAAIAWLLADPRVAQVVVGPGRPAQLQPVCEALANPLTHDERDRLSEIFS